MNYKQAMSKKRRETDKFLRTLLNNAQVSNFFLYEKQHSHHIVVFSNPIVNVTSNFACHSFRVRHVLITCRKEKRVEKALMHVAPSSSLRIIAK